MGTAILSSLLDQLQQYTLQYNTTQHNTRNEEKPARHVVNTDHRIIEFVINTTLNIHGNKNYKMANEALERAGMHFDDLNRIRVLDENTSSQASELKEVCHDFLTDIADFQGI